MIKKIRFGSYEYNVWESTGLWMAKMVGSVSPLWDFQECSEDQLYNKMKGCHDFPLVVVEDKKESVRKSLYREDESFTEEAGELQKEVRDLMEPIVTKWVEKGYSYREVCALAGNSTDLIKTIGIIKNYHCSEEE